MAQFDRISEAPDAVPRLRRFIIDLAVRGKLVPQALSDKPASNELGEYLRPSASPHKLRSDRRNERDFDLGMGTKVPFELPANWAWLRFGDVADFSAGRTPSRNDLSYWNSGDYPWVSIADMQDAGVVLRTKESISNKAREQVFRAEPSPSGTLIMSFKLTIGKISRLGIPAFHNEAIISIYPRLQSIEPYLFMALPTFSRQGDTRDAIKGATLNRASIASMLLPIPPLAEQRRIVEKVDELMALCDRLETAQEERERRRSLVVSVSLNRLNAPSSEFRDDARFHFRSFEQLTMRPEHVQQLRKTILNLAVRGRLVSQDGRDEPASKVIDRIKTERMERWSRRRPSRKSDATETVVPPFSLPSNWSWTQLGILAVDMRYGTSKKCSREHVGVPVLRIPNVSSGSLDLEDLKYGLLTENEINELRLERGDLLVIRSNGSLQIVGRSAEIDSTAEAMCFAGYLVRVRFYAQDVCTRFVWMVMNSDHVRAQIEKPIRSTVGLKNVNSTELSQLTIPLPPLAEQRRIVAKVDELMALCDRLEAQLAAKETGSQRFLEAVLHEALRAPTEVGVPV
jgi:type I restriction enzyme S subunit